MNDFEFNIFHHVKRNSKLEDIVEYHGIKLKREKEYSKGTCPFCKKEGDTFTVSRKKEVFYCFGCHEGGDVITFQAKLKEITQVEAAYELKEIWFELIQKDPGDKQSLEIAKFEVKETIEKLCGLLDMIE
ncbi:hypothetical protein KY314_04785 [Candidatus Woesearchaeota archaeon]|nr:hypothetical protein [Candidatus Woesearchaeota archaeon]